MAKLAERVDNDRERFLTPAQVAELLCVNCATIYKLIKAAQIDHVRVGSLIRVPLEAVASYLAQDQRDSR